MQMDLADLFGFSSASELRAFAKSANISRDHFARLIMGVMGDPRSPLMHFSIFRAWHAEHLIPTDHEMRALRRNGVGPFTPETARLVRKLSQGWKEERRRALHLFWEPRPSGRWWLFHFSNADTASRDPHWEGGPHVHLVTSYTHPNLHPASFVEALQANAKARLPQGVHIRFTEAA